MSTESEFYRPTTVLRVQPMMAGEQRPHEHLGGHRRWRRRASVAGLVAGLALAGGTIALAVTQTPDAPAAPSEAPTAPAAVDPGSETLTDCLQRVDGEVEAGDPFAAMHCDELNAAQTEAADQSN